MAKGNGDSRVWEYMDGAEFQGRLMLIAGYLGQMIEDDTAVLDLDCGTGPILQYLPQCSYLGNDIDPGALMDAHVRYGTRPDTVFLRATDEQIAARASIACDILLAIGYGCGFSDKESHTLDDSIRSIVTNATPRVVVLEGWSKCLDYAFGELVAWIEEHGYRALPWWRVVPTAPTDHRTDRVVVILERKGACYDGRRHAGASASHWLAGDSRSLPGIGAQVAA